AAGHAARALYAERAGWPVDVHLLPDPVRVHGVGLAADRETGRGFPANVALPPLRRGLPTVPDLLRAVAHLRRDRHGRHFGRRVSPAVLDRLPRRAAQDHVLIPAPAAV